VNLFIDRDLGKRLGRALRTVGVKVTLHIERYPVADAESVADQKWIEDAAIAGDVILTRDGKIRRIPAELAAVIAANARCFVLETGNATSFDYLRAVVIAWPAMERVVRDVPPPFMYGVSRAGRLTRRYP